MRWLFYDPLNTSEAASRAMILRKIDTWWKAFQAKRDDLDDWFAQRRHWDLPGWMDERLHAIDPRLMWEFGSLTSRQDRYLVITPEGSRHLRPMLADLIGRAPPIDGWKFYPWRPREDVETARLSVQAKGGHDIADCRVRAAINRRRKIELTFLAPGCEEPDEPSWLSTAFLACESVLGEETLDRWIGLIEVAPAASRKRSLLSRLGRSGREDKADGLPLERLAEMVDSLAEAVLDQLPREPLFRSIGQANWATYELDPEEDGEPSGKSDLAVAISAAPPIFEAVHGGGIFCSSCHSRCGETFCYLKIDGSEGLPAASRFDDRAAIEDALNEALIPRELGCVIGGGTGLRHSYIDLALVNLPVAVQAVRDTLLAGGVPQRSWLLFYDDELAQEWVGIYPDAPEPPLGKEEE